MNTENIVNDNEMVLVSANRHKVFTNGEKYLKQARSNENAHEIVLEYSVQKALGQNVQLFPGPPVAVLTPKLGTQLTKLNSETVRKQANVVQSMKNLDKEILEDIAKLAPDINTIRTNIKNRMATRIAEGKVPEKLLNLIPKELELDKFDLTLVHADPRPENWVKNNKDELTLIDWESACFAPWEFGLASLVSHTIEYGYPQLVSEIIDEASRTTTIDYSLYEWSMKLRAASVSSWYYFDEGEESGNKWYQKILNNIYG